MTDRTIFPPRIWLLPGTGDEGETTWCDDPTPQPGMSADEAVEYVRVDLADALLSKLGPRAVAALLADKAAVVPTVPTSNQKREVWGSDEMPVFDWTLAKDFWLRMIAAGRLDRGDAP